ncbi:TOMM precursor leader peptide-binding protein [Mycolicibacterium sp. 018/SC-01/001]|uniref:TOMM precursor leader peptide-binding protein n=1 Tax=Mycolicibacterium sp. 018/SC-01/001 TaxID=2592069 RepID=UPI00117DCEA0|nr:TOMM precursor leader peptide-binding protein [Mycolicibacterium sp. 018/SC-01/001]TRW81170.1 TOMM precursor leader peptide-binding protein [Mycolicibacterium sp. 018/SC-01/001]
MTRYALDSATPVLSRPDGTVQVGWDPRRAVVVHPPPGLAAPVVADLLRALQTAATVPELQILAAGRGADATVVTDLIAHLVDSGVLTTAAPPPARSPSVRVHGEGPLSDLISATLTSSGVRVTSSSMVHASAAGADLAVLADYLVADPRVARDLHHAGVPHLAVRVRDGTGLVGPLVIPGATSCLRCADLHRSDKDPAWAAVATQLSRTVGTADRATVLATAGLALREIAHILRVVRPGAGPVAPAPATVDTTLEFDLNSGTVTARRWSPHPDCSC